MTYPNNEIIDQQITDTIGHYKIKVQINKPVQITAESDKLFFNTITATFSAKDSNSFITEPLTLPAILSMRINFPLGEYQKPYTYLLDSNGDNVYFIQLAYNTAYYTVQLLTFLVPTLAGIGTYTRPPSGLYSTSGTGLPTISRVPQITFASTGSIRSIIGFAAGTFPTTSQTSNYNTSSSLTPMGSTVNSLIMQCSLISNRCTIPSDIIDSMPINDTSFGSNIIYNPSFEKFVSISDGTFNNFTFSFRDQNLNEIYARDPNVSITLIIRPKRN